MPITPQQKQAAQSAQHQAAHDTSPQVLLVAGPGTGKSHAIQERVRWLLSSGVHPRSIFVVSFTRASARDLRERIQDYCRQHACPQGAQVSVTTLHSLALRILGRAGLLSRFPVAPLVLDDWELTHIWDQEFSAHCGQPSARCKDIRRDHEAFWSTTQWSPPTLIPPDPPITPAERSSFAQFHTPRAQTYSCVLPGEIVTECLRQTAAGAITPAELMAMHHLVVDEYQDLNPCDVGFLDQLIQAGVTVLVAGDDDQSIYSFRFAHPAGIRTFRTRHNGATQHVLSHCFRSTPAVLHAALALINAYTLGGRIPKQVVSLYANAAPPLQGRVLRWRFANAGAEARAIAESCRELIAAGIPPREILLLVSNRPILLSTLTSALNHAGVPYDTPGADGYVESDEGRLALACLRVICNPDDYVAHRTILGLLPRVGPVTCHNIVDAVLANHLNYVQVFRGTPPAAVFGARERRALDRARAAIAPLSQAGATDTLRQRDAAMQAVVDSVLGSAAQQAWVQNTGHLPRDMILEEVRDYLWADTDEQQLLLLNSVYDRLGQTPPGGGALPPRVRIMTMHGAKGLSGQVVFIPGIEGGILPHSNAARYPGLLYESARVLYMSITRAQAACILTYADGRQVYGSWRGPAPSQFLASLGGPFVSRNAGLSQAEAAAIEQDCRQL